MAKAMTTMEAIRKVLKRSNGPLKASEIAAKVVPMVPGLQGKTPAATVAAKLYTEAKKPDSWIRKVDDGFVLATSDTLARADDSPLGDVPATIVRDGRTAKPDPKPAGRRSKATSA